VKSDPPKLSVTQFSTRVLEDHGFLMSLPRRHRPPTYDQARRVMWLVIRERLAAEGRTFKCDQATKVFIQNLLAWGCQLDGVMSGPWGSFRTYLDRTRGIWVFGEPGVGKTFLVECFAITMAALGHLDRGFRFVNMKELEQQLRSTKDLAILDKFTRGRWIFDDVGFESGSRIYGNEVEPFEVIMNSRYQRFKRGRLLTIVTSNFPMQGPGGEDVIAELYDKRLSRRVREMMQQWHLNSYDKSVVDG